MFKKLSLQPYNYAKLFTILNIFLLLILPQLSNIHYDPLPQFYAEITFAILAISLFIITIIGSKQICIPKISVGITCLALFIFIQQFFVELSFVSMSYILILEMFICLLIAISFNTLVYQYGITIIFKYICISLVIGGIIQSLIGFTQYTGLATKLNDFIFYDDLHPTSNIFGHFGQRNHYCHYLTWSFFALIYLQYIKKIPTYIFLLGATWLSFSITIGASRSIFIYFILSFIIGGINLITCRNKGTLRLFYLILLSCIFIFTIEYLYPLILHVIGDNDVSGLSRIIADSSNGAGRREVEWLKAWITFKEHPLLGIGWSEYAKQSVYLQYLFPNAPLNDGLFTNCHNLILQLLAETGITGTIIVIAGISYPLYYITQSRIHHNTEIILLLCMLATTLSHSMLEYPLWYMYFLGVFILLLSIDKPISILPRQYIVTLFIIPLIYIVYLLITNIIIFNKLVVYTEIPDNNQQQFKQQVNYLEYIINNNQLLSYSALYTLDDYIDISSPTTNAILSPIEQLTYVTKLVNFHPYPDTLIKQAQLYWNMGNHDQACKIISTAILAFPVYKTAFLEQLSEYKYKSLYNIVAKYQNIKQKDTTNAKNSISK